jgi:hypothetical protein
MDWLEQTLSYSLVLAWWQQLGLAFLLGSFAVATLSDLKYLSAQREFLEVWLLFIFGVLVFDFYDLHSGSLEPAKFAVKWGLIALLSVLSHKHVGVLFRLATGDTAALAAAACLLPPTLILIFYAIAKAITWLAQRVLFPNRAYWPFMPVVSLATLAVMALGFALVSR